MADRVDTTIASYLGQLIRQNEPDWIGWRRDLHSNPELAFEETRTATFVASKLKQFGYEVTTGLGRTGVVGKLKVGNGTKMIGLRADMDALPMHEENEFAHKSTRIGCMHGCGHDGHTAMLLAAAQLLAATRNFDGTLVLIFQPAEEAAGGSLAMINDGLFEKFPVDAVFGMHNIPGIEQGKFGVMPGPMMASFDTIDITVEGLGGHAAFPHKSVDAIAAACALVGSLQQIVARNCDPFDQAVLSITQFTAGESYNVLPQKAILRGTVRCFDSQTQDFIEQRIHEVCQGIDLAWNTRTDVLYKRCYPPTINTQKEALFAASVIRSHFGDEALLAKTQALMAAEDFAFMLRSKPGAYVWIGNGVGELGGCMVHNPRYDFNDQILSQGARYWSALAQAWLCSETFGR